MGRVLQEPWRTEVSGRHAQLWCTEGWSGQSVSWLPGHSGIDDPRKSSPEGGKWLWAEEWLRKGLRGGWKRSGTCCLFLSVFFFLSSSSLTGRGKENSCLLCWLLCAQALCWVLPKCQWALFLCQWTERCSGGRGRGLFLPCIPSTWYVSGTWWDSVCARWGATHVIWGLWVNPWNIPVFCCPHFIDSKKRRTRGAHVLWARPSSDGSRSQVWVTLTPKPVLPCLC